jgi:hypothetical protein
VKKATRGSFSVVGIGAPACVACCAGPLLAFLGGLGIAGLASILVIGAAGLLVTEAAVAVIAIVRRRRTTCDVPEGPVPVAVPTRRAPAP